MLGPRAWTDCTLLSLVVVTVSLAEDGWDEGVVSPIVYGNDGILRRIGKSYYIIYCRWTRDCLTKTRIYVTPNLHQLL
jgi:hypothetical protein